MTIRPTRPYKNALRFTVATVLFLQACARAPTALPVTPTIEPARTSSPEELSVVYNTLVSTTFQNLDGPDYSRVEVDKAAFARENWGEPIDRDPDSFNGLDEEGREQKAADLARKSYTLILEKMENSAFPPFKSNADILNAFGILKGEIKPIDEHSIEIDAVSFNALYTTPLFVDAIRARAHFNISVVTDDKGRWHFRLLINSDYYDPTHPPGQEKISLADQAIALDHEVRHYESLLIAIEAYQKLYGVQSDSEVPVKFIEVAQFNSLLEPYAFWGTAALTDRIIAADSILTQSLDLFFRDLASKRREILQKGKDWKSPEWESSIPVH